MTFSTIKKLCLTSAVALTMFTANGAFAQSTATVTVASTFATAAGISAAAVNPLDFGTFITVRNGTDTLEVVVDPEAGTPNFTVNAPSTSTFQATVNPATAGSFTVTSPIDGVVYITADPATAYADPAIALGTLLYSVGGAPGAAIPTTGTTAAVTTAAGVATTVEVGGTLTITGSLPFSTPYTGSVDVDITL